MHGNGFNRGEMRKAGQQAPHGPPALVGVSDLFITTEGDGAAPVVFILNLFDLQAGARVFAQGANLAPDKRMDIDRLAVQHIADRHDVRRALSDTAEMSDAGSFEQRPRLVRAHWPDHSFPSSHLPTAPVQSCSGPRTISTEQRACAAPASDTDPSSKRLKPL